MIRLGWSLMMVGLLCIAGCGPASPEVLMPVSMLGMTQQDFKTDATETVWGPALESWPVWRLNLSWQEQAQGAVGKYKLHEEVATLLQDQMTANDMPLDDLSNAVLQVQIVEAGAPKSSDAMRLVKVRLAAWLTLEGQEQPVLQGTFDGVKCISHIAHPTRDAYEEAAQDAVSRLVRKLRVAKGKVPTTVPDAVVLDG